MVNTSSNKLCIFQIKLHNLNIDFPLWLMNILCRVTCGMDTTMWLHSFDNDVCNRAKGFIEKNTHCVLQAVEKCLL